LIRSHFLKEGYMNRVHSQKPASRAQHPVAVHEDDDEESGNESESDGTTSNEEIAGPAHSSAKGRLEDDGGLSAAQILSQSTIKVHMRHTKR
jgi:hypothetical protein